MAFMGKNKMMSILGVFVISATMFLAGCTDDGGGDNSIRVVTLAPIDMQNSLESGDIAGYVAWEPYCSDSVVNGKGKALYRSEDIWPGQPCCVLAADKDYVKHFLKVHMESNLWIANALSDTNSADYTTLVNIAVEFTQRSEAVVKEALTHVTFTYELNTNFINGLQTYTDKLIDYDIITNDKVTERGYSDTTDFVDTYVDESYLNSAQSITASNASVGTVRVGYLLGDIHHLAFAVAKSSDAGGGESMFSQYGITVVDATGAPYANGGSEMDHFAAGDVDIGYLGGAPAVLKHINSGINTVVLAQANSEGSAIIVADDIDSIKDLRGKKFGIPGFPTVQYFLLRMIAEQEDVKITS
jgi:NitT/TauT family transport system substrate-binding protein